MADILIPRGCFYSMDGDKDREIEKKDVIR